MWQLGGDTSPVPAGLEYPRGGGLGMSQYLDGQSSVLISPACKQFLAILQVWGNCLARRDFFEQSERLAGHAGEGLHPHSIGL